MDRLWRWGGIYRLPWVDIRLRQGYGVTSKAYPYIV
jgi:hypothetical protein